MLLVLTAAKSMHPHMYAVSDSMLSVEIKSVILQDISSKHFATLAFLRPVTLLAAVDRDAWSRSLPSLSSTNALGTGNVRYRVIPAQYGKGEMMRMHDV